MYATLNYLKDEDALNKAITREEQVNIVRNVDSDRGGADFEDKTRSDDGTNKIKYNPMVGLATIDDDQINKQMADREQGLIQSPALGFLHELDHFVGYITGQEKRVKPDGTVFDSPEERRVVTESETTAAIRLGEPIRTNHNGVPVKVEGPTSRTKVDDVPSVKMVLLQRQQNQNSQKKP